MDESNSRTPTTFLNLPAELRNKIYRLHYFRGIFFIYTCAGRPWSTVLDLYCTSHIPLALLRSCRQVRSEAARILYGENVFAFPDEKRCAMDFQRWLELIGTTNCKVLRSIIISPSLAEFPCEVRAAFIECSRLLQDATELNLPKVKPELRKDRLQVLNLKVGDKCKKIIVRRIGMKLEMAWVELGNSR